MAKKPIYKRSQYRKTVQPYVDMDYQHKLNDEESAWLNQFSQEYYVNNRKYEDRIMGDEYNKRNSDAGNARDRDIMTRNSYSVTTDPIIYDRLIKEEVDEVSNSLNIHGFEYTMNRLISESLNDINEISDDQSAQRLIIINLIQKTQKALKLQKQFERNESKIRKEAEKL